jgi:L-threonylcarbamoyladenylate synthase
VLLLADLADHADHAPRVLRPGLISAEQIASVIKQPVAEFVPGLKHEGTLNSPGLLEKHYAPATRTQLVSLADLRNLLTSVRSAVVISHVALAIAPPHHLELLPADARGYAAGLYAALRSADARRCDLIAVIAPPTDGSDAAIWQAITDRLRRASA